MNSKLNYGIFAFDFQYPQLKWIVKEIKTSIQEKVRDNIIVIDVEDLGLTNNSDIIEISSKLEEMLNEKIRNFTKSANRLSQEKHKISALELWKSNITKTAAPKRESKANKKVSISKRGSTPAKKTECTMQNIKYKNGVANPISHLRNRKNYIDDNMKKIEDGPEYGIALYIVLLDFSDVEIYFSLLENKFNLLAVIYLYNSWEELDIENKLLALQNSELTKNINISTQYVNALSKFLSKKYSKNIYDEFCWYLYDLEFKRTEYENYLDNIEELDIEEKEFPNSIFETISQLQIPITAPDEIIILIYLNTLLNLSSENSIETDMSNTNESNDSNEKLQDIYHIENHQTSIFIHNDNRLMKSIYASEMENFKYVNLIRFAKSISLAYNLELYSNSILFEPYSDLEILEFKTSENDDCFYMQKFNEEVSFQKIEGLLCKFDKVICSVMDKNVFIFGQYKEGFNSECEKKYVLLNKICFRDFCYYGTQIIQDVTSNTGSTEITNNTENRNTEYSLSLNFIRTIALKNLYKEKFVLSTNSLTNTSKFSQLENEDSTILNKKMIVYKLGDTQQQINFLEYYYRSEFIGVKCYTDKWVDGKIYMRINTAVFGNCVFYNKQLFGERNNAIRIITKCGISIDLFCESDNSECCHIFIAWPNKLYIKVIFCNEMLLKLVQNSLKKYNKEERRQFMDDGTLLIFYENNLVTVLRPNGTIYCTTSLTKQLEKECTQPSYLDALYDKYLQDIKYITKFEDILDSKNYTITTSDGINFEIENNIIKQQFRKFLVTEWIDYLIGNIYIHREDEVKLVYTEEYLECNYADGTTITTYLFDKILFNFDDADDDEKISEDNESNKIIETILDVIINYILGVGFSNCEFTYVMQHVNYAQIDISNQYLQIKNPEEVDILLENGNINVELEHKIYIIYNKDVCTIRCTNSEICDFNINFNFNTNDEILFTLEENGQIFEILHNHTCLVNKKVPDDKNGNIRQSKILNFSTYGGNEKFAKEELDSYLETINHKNKPFIYNDEKDELVVLIFPLEKYEDIFKMCIDNVENLKQFEKYYFIFKIDVNNDNCPPIFTCQTNEAIKLKKDCLPVFTFSVFFKECVDIKSLESNKLKNSTDLSSLDSTILNKCSDIICIKKDKLNKCKCFKINLSNLNKLTDLCSLEKNKSLKYSIDIISVEQNKSKKSTDTYLLENNNFIKITDITSLESNKEYGGGDDDIKFIDFQDILYSAVKYLEEECELNLQEVGNAKRNALESKIMYYNLQKLGIHILQKLVLCKIFPQYFDFIGNYENIEEDNDLVDSYLQNKISKK